MTSQPPRQPKRQDQRPYPSQDTIAARQRGPVRGAQYARLNYNGYRQGNQRQPADPYQRGPYRRLFLRQRRRQVADGQQQQAFSNNSGTPAPAARGFPPLAAEP